MSNRSFTLPLLVAASVAAVAGCGSSGGGTSSKKGVAATNGASAANGTFSTVASLSTGRVYHTATWIPQVEKVLIAGGKGRSGSTDAVLDTAELYDPKTGTMSPVQGKLKGNNQTGQNGRMFHSAIALPLARVLIVGGQTDVAGTTQLNSLEVYNALSTTGQFGTVSGVLSEVKAQPTLFEYPGTTGTPEIGIAGGRKRSGSADIAVASVNFYKPDSNSITNETKSMTQARWGAKAQALANGKIMLSGGSSSATAAAGSEMFDVTARSFAASSANFKNRVAFDAAKLGTDAALFGGLDASGATIDSIEFYNETQSQWQAVTARLRQPRSGHTVSRLSNGEVIVIGGLASGQVLGTTEIVSGSGLNATVSQGPALRTPRKNHTATVFTATVNNVATEMILVAGGEDAFGAPIASCEVFTFAGTGINVFNPPINAQAPVLQSLSPTSGNIGTQVIVKGTGFALANFASANIVKFNGILAPVTQASQNGAAIDLTVTVPQGATTGDVTVTVGGLTSATGPQSVFTIGTSTNPGGGTGTGTGGTQFNGPPRIFILLPTSGPSFMPLGIGGTNFDTGTIPYVNNMPSLSLFNFSTRQLPLIGSISVGFTIVPPQAPSGAGFVQLNYFGALSNTFPFTKN
jgi:hypothetical protein